MSEHPPYYGSVISRNRQQEYIEEVLAKYKGEDANQELKEKVYYDLMHLKDLGLVTIPFSVELTHDESGHHIDTVTVLLDTKV